MSYKHQPAQLSRSSKHDVHAQQSADSFEYNDSNEKYIGKRTGNRYQRVQQKQHYDGFPRFSDYQTLGSNKSRQPQSSIQQSNQKPQQAFNFLSQTTKRANRPEQKLEQSLEAERDDEVLQTKIHKEQQQRQTIQFEFKDPYDSHSYSQVGSSRLPNPNQPVNTNKAFGQISTIKRKTMSPVRRTSQHNTYRQLVDNLREDLAQQIGVNEQQFLFADPPNKLQIEEKQTVKQISNSRIKKKKGSRVSFNQNTDLILNQSEVYETDKHKPKQDIDIGSQHYKGNGAGIVFNENKLEIEEQINSNTNNESGEYPKQIKKLEKQEVLDVEVNQKHMENIDNENKARKKKKKNAKPERVSSRIREQVIRQIRQSQEKKQKKPKKKLSPRQIQSKSKQITLSNSKKPAKNSRNNQKRTKVRMTQTTDSHTQPQIVSFSADQQINARYPKRTRVKPLQFWDNERIVYNTKGKAVGIQNLHIDIGKILGMRDFEQHAQLMSAKLIDIETGQIQAQIKYPLSYQLSFLGFSAPYVSLRVQPTAVLSHKTKELIRELNEGTSILIDDGVKTHQIAIVIDNQDEQRRESEWIEIGADTRFTIFSETKHGGSLDSVDSHNSSNSNRIRNAHVVIRCRLRKKGEDDDHNQNLYER